MQSKSKQVQDWFEPKLLIATLLMFVQQSQELEKNF